MCRPRADRPRLGRARDALTIDSMPLSSTKPRRSALRAELLELVRSSRADRTAELTAETSLIRSGRIDSLALFNVALVVEREIGHAIDFVGVDLAAEWDSVDDVLDFIEARRSTS